MKQELGGKLATVLAASVLVVLGFSIGFSWKNVMSDKILYRLREPMLISTSKGEPYYMLPTNTVLRYQRGFSEGHQLYSVEVFAKGSLPADKIASDTDVDSTWIYPIDADEVSNLLKNYPLSKEDLVRILKARKITRDDLAQLVREWKDD